MPIAKETLYIGWAIAANPGNYVTKAAVAEYGWQDLVEDGPDLGGTEDDGTPKAAGGRKSQQAAKTE